MSSAVSSNGRLAGARSPAGSRSCGLCGKAATSNRIAFTCDLPLREDGRPVKGDSARLDMPLCHGCAARVLKHLKRMFSLPQLGIESRPKAPDSWSVEL